jgi:hypothetical protein
MSLKMKYILSLLLLFLCISFTVGQDTIINTESQWKYYDGATPLPENWMIDATEQPFWKTGISAFGYGYGTVKTTIDYGEDERNKNIISYFEKEVVVTSPFENLVYELRLRRDDGALLYINGIEIWRSNMSDKNALVTEPHVRIEGDNEGAYHSKLIPATSFREGTNRISVMIYQNNSTTSDCIFDLQLIAHNEIKYLSYLLTSKEIENTALTERLKKLSYQQEIQQKELDNKLLIQSEAFNKVFKNVIVVLLFIVIIGALLYFRSSKKKLAQKDLLIYQLEKEKESSDRDLLNKTIFSLKHDQYLNEIKLNLEIMVEEKNVSQSTLKKLIQNINNNLNKEEINQNLESQFNIVHTGFLDRLKNKCSSLTSTELRHCIFIKLLMSTKDIAKLMNISPRSVQTNRYRIKKKMNLGEEEDLKDIITKI